MITGVRQDLEGCAMFGGKDFWWTPLARSFMLDFESVGSDLVI
jgi:hypothetical protein